MLDSGFKLDATSAARQAGITDPNKQRTVLKRVKLLKEKAAEMMQSPLQSYTTRLLALNPGLCALGKTTPKPKQKRAQKVPKTGLRIAEQVPRPAIGSRKRSAGMHIYPYVLLTCSHAYLYAYILLVCIYAHMLLVRLCCTYPYMLIACICA